MEQGFRESVLVREDTFSAPEDAYFQGEPYAVAAQFDQGGNLEIWMPNAGPHLKAKPLSNVLKIPLNKVRVRKIAIGGAFGGRSEISPADVICAFLAKKARRPVKIVYTREENTVATRQAHSMITRIKTGVDQNGKVLARDITCHMDGGAYSSTGPIAVSVPFLCMEQAYRMDNVRYNGYRILTNKPIRGMYRTHGRAFACGIDLQLDKLGPGTGPGSCDDALEERPSDRGLYPDQILCGQLRVDRNDREVSREIRLERKVGQAASLSRHRYRL